jgi:replication factor C subunit 3/5
MNSKYIINLMNKNVLDLGGDDIAAESKYLVEDDTHNIVYNLPWIEKYRPENFDDIISHNDILNALKKLIDNKSLPHLIFYGPPGTGKTTTILACAKKMYGSNYKNMILELNGSDDRGINVVREQIKDFSVSKQFIGNFSNNPQNNIKLVILDEADSMTYDAQFALRRVIENYTYNTRFCLICNYGTKIIDALKSRCVIFRFSPIPTNIHLEKLKYICETESVDIMEDALDIIIKLSEGDMRKSINLIQAINTVFTKKDKIVQNDVLKQIGYPLVEDKDNIINMILNKKISLEDTIKQIEHFKLQFGLTTADILREISNAIVKKITLKNMVSYSKILDKLGDVEVFMSISYNDTVLLGSIISIIKNNI